MMRSLITIALAGAALFAVVLEWFLLVEPARNEVQETVSIVQGRVFEQLDERLALLAGRRDRSGLEAIRDKARVRAEQAETLLKQQSLRLLAWFAQLPNLGPKDFPNRDEFAQAHAFGKDELRREIWELVGKVPESAHLARYVDNPALHVPVFEKAGRDPERKELGPAQRLFNIQRMMLLAAARAGAVPHAPLKLEPLRTKPGASRHFKEELITLHLLVPSSRLPRLLRGLIEVGGTGPVCRLAGLETKPHAFPETLRLNEIPPIKVEVRMVLVTYKLDRT